MENNSNYDFEIEKILAEIKKQKAKTVALQFPDGLKPFAQEIIKELEQKTSAKIFLYGGTNFGACDIPALDVDLLIHFGHSAWN
jgi:2-(3-amino-3-carboxypropyl)histidine synthase